ncbi:stage II sporulation protein R [Schnuerera sp. xch1]|uniref:stage II sporulation protein R n=1 Tax=Schnuerera sp. xch1 TaxID=2874283 RepID=UPI001CBD433E|nr:stage II sporulation protein R [Schnuerera sp. xch1]MBZ2175092.1 stage II sporulation protein R [Schnuerera sp. xch1]
MKHKNLILILAILIISIIYIIQPYTSSKNAYMDDIKNEIIRFHVKANSDIEEDQSLKLKIRDKILKETQTELENSESIHQTKAIMEDNLDNIKSIAEEVIEDEGKDYSVDVYLGKKDFPTKKYGNVVFPAGEYETLQVTIGEGKGQNWWCVMFPPLCFVEMRHGNAANVEEGLKEVLSEDEVGVLLAEKASPIILKSKILEVVEKTKVYIADRIAQSK